MRSVLFIKSFTLFVLGAIFISSCSQPFRSDPNAAQAPAFIAPASEPTPLPENISLQGSEPGGDNPSDCVNNLKYIDDLTIPDGTFVEQDAILEKQWEVENTGTCNWLPDYSLQHIGGQLLGANAQQTLYPAKKGTRAVISITFFAPSEIGTYHTAWQAFDSTGTAFGDPIYMDIVVTSTNP